LEPGQRAIYHPAQFASLEFAMPDPLAVRQNALRLFEGFDELEEPEGLVMAILLDAISLVEAYRYVKRKDVAQLPELTKSVDALLSRLEIIRRTNEWAKEEATQ
jgi:hypothetical protein